MKPRFIALFACLLLAGALALPAGAAAGQVDLAKKQTRSKVTALGGKLIKNSCRAMGKKGIRGVKCRWVYARLFPPTLTRNCKGSSRLPYKGKQIRFETEKCSTDKGATSVNELLPQKLLLEGYESTSAFCFTTLGDGYNCEWEAVHFTPTAMEDCKGTARSADRTVTLAVTGCVINAQATLAQTAVKAVLASRGLSPDRVNCKLVDGVGCDWEASRGSSGWRYLCEGRATAATAAGPFEVDSCRLHTTGLAPLNPGENGGQAFGVNEGWPLYPGKLDLLANDFHATTARFIVSWNNVQPSQGGLLNFNGTDDTYERMLARGIKPIVIIQSAPCWATSTPGCTASASGFPPDPAHLDEWQNFARAVAAHYDEARAIEVWTEADAGLFYRGGPKPGEYVGVLEHAYDGIKNQTLSIPVLTTGTAAFANNGPGQMRYDEFLRDIYEQGAKNFSDGIGHHAYPGGGPTSDYEAGVRGQIADLKDVMLDFGDEDKPIWITEYGVSTTGPAPYTEEQQAIALVKLYRVLRRIPGIAASVVHRWEDDGAATGELIAERGFGLTRKNGTQKPVYCALAKARTGVDPGGC